MSVANILGTVVSQNSYQRARASVANMQGGNLRSGDALSMVQQFVQGTNVSTNTSPFSGSGTANLGIHPAMLRKAANDPEQMVRLKALAMDISEAQAASTRALESRGITVIARGAIIHEDGSSSGWSITRSPDLRGERRSQFQLPESDRQSWVEIMRENIERAMENGSRGWRI